MTHSQAVQVLQRGNFPPRPLLLVPRLPPSILALPHLYFVLDVVHIALHLWQFLCEEVGNVAACDVEAHQFFITRSVQLLQIQDPGLDHLEQFHVLPLQV